MNLADLRERLKHVGECDRREGCVCGGDLPRVRAGCSYFVKSPIGPAAATVLTALIDPPDALVEAAIREMEATMYPGRIMPREDYERLFRASIAAAAAWLGEVE